MNTNIKKIFQIKTMDLIGFARFVSIIILAVRKLFGFSNIVNKKRDGFHWELNLKEAIDFSLYFTGNYEPDIVTFYRKNLNLNDVVIDVGANVGAHAIRMADIVGDKGVIYALEPTQFALTKLRKNISLNSALASRIEVHPVFLQASSGEVAVSEVSSSWSIDTPMNNDNRNQLDCGFAMSTEGASGLTLDDFVTQKSISRIDMIKLDVDGQEVKVIKGASSVLENFSPLLIVECAPMHFYSTEETFQDFINLILMHGYKMYGLDMKPLDFDAKELEASLKYGAARDVIFKKSK